MGGRGGQEIEERQRGIKEKMMGGCKAWRRNLIKGKMASEPKKDKKVGREKK